LWGWNKLRLSNSKVLSGIAAVFLGTYLVAGPSVPIAQAQPKPAQVKPKKGQNVHYMPITQGKDLKLDSIVSLGNYKLTAPDDSYLQGFLSDGILTSLERRQAVAKARVNHKRNFAVVEAASSDGKEKLTIRVYENSVEILSASTSTVSAQAKPAGLEGRLSPGTVTTDSKGQPKIFAQLPVEHYRLDTGGDVMRALKDLKEGKNPGKIEAAVTDYAQRNYDLPVALSTLFFDKGGTRASAQVGYNDCDPFGMAAKNTVKFGDLVKSKILTTEQILSMMYKAGDSIVVLSCSDYKTIEKEKKRFRMHGETSDGKDNKYNWRYKWNLEGDKLAGKVVSITREQGYRIIEQFFGGVYDGKTIDQIRRRIDGHHAPYWSSNFNGQLAGSNKVTVAPAPRDNSGQIQNDFVLPRGHKFYLPRSNLRN